MPPRAYIWYATASIPPIYAGIFPAWIFLRVRAGFFFRFKSLASSSEGPPGCHKRADPMIRVHSHRRLSTVGGRKPSQPRRRAKSIGNLSMVPIKPPQRKLPYGGVDKISGNCHLEWARRLAIGAGPQAIPLNSEPRTGGKRYSDQYGCSNGAHRMG